MYCSWAPTSRKIGGDGLRPSPQKSRKFAATSSLRARKLFNPPWQIEEHDLEWTFRNELFKILLQKVAARKDFDEFSRAAFEVAD